MGILMMVLFSVHDDRKLKHISMSDEGGLTHEK